MITYPEFFSAFDRIVNAINAAELADEFIPSTVGMTDSNATYLFIGHYISALTGMAQADTMQHSLFAAVNILMYLKRQYGEPFTNDCIPTDDIEGPALDNWASSISDMAHANAITFLGLASFNCSDELQDVSVWCQTQLLLLASFCLTHFIDLESIIRGKLLGVDA